MIHSTYTPTRAQAEARAALKNIRTMRDIRGQASAASPWRGLLHLLLLLCMAAGVAHAEPGAPAFGVSTLTVNGVEYTLESNTDENDQNGNLVRQMAIYHDAPAAHQLNVWADAGGTGGISDGGSNMLGLVFSWALYFNQSLTYDSTNAASPYGLSSYNLFHNTYEIRTLTYALHTEAGQNVLDATESYTGGNGGTMSVFYQNLNTAGYGTGCKFRGNDPIVGDFEGSYISPGQLILNRNRSAPGFAKPGDSLWVNSTLVTWEPSGFVTSDGDAVDTYTGTDVEGYTVTLTVSGNVPAFSNGEGINPTVTLTVRDGDLNVHNSGEGTYVKGSPNYFSVTGTFVVVAQPSRELPLWLPGERSLWVNGTRYAFRGGVDDGAGTSVDTYVNDSVGRLLLYGNSSAQNPMANVRVSYPGMTCLGTFNEEGSGAFFFPVEGMIVEMSGTAVPAIWVNGRLYLRSPSDDTIYVPAAMPGQLSITVSGGNVVVDGTDENSTFSGSFPVGSGGVFHCTRANGASLPACPVNANGSLRLYAVNPPAEMPPAIAINDAIWSFLGSTGNPDDPTTQTAYYGNAAVGLGSTFLTIAGDGQGNSVVTLTDCTEYTSKTGGYSLGTHLFQTAPGQLPMPIYGTAPTDNNVRWGWLLPRDGRPATVLVDGEVWGFTGRDGDGADHYAGYYSGQEITIAAPVGWGGTGMVTLGTGAGSYTGIYYKGGFQLSGGSPAVTSGNDRGTAGPGDGLGRYQNIWADLDISGNMLTLGSWNPDVGRAGMTLQYSEPSTDGKALIYMIGSRQDTSWIWNHATATGSTTTPMMLLAGADHSLKLFRPSDSANAAITLNPSGQSYWLNFGPYPDTSAATTVGGTNRTKGIFVVGAGTNATRRNAMRITEDGVVLIQESGDIPMGEFTAGPRP